MRVIGLMPTSLCVPILPPHGLPFGGSTWVLGAHRWAPYRRRWRERAGNSFCPRGTSKLRGSSNNTSEAMRKQNRRKEPSTQLSGSALRNIWRLQGQVEPRGASEGGQDPNKVR